MTNLIILAGIPGTGKSTWAKTFFDLKYTVVSSDAIRKRKFASLKAAHDPSVKKQANKEVFTEFHQRIRDGLTHNVDVIADATFLTRESREKVRTIAKETGARTHLVLFKNVLEGLNRNSERDEDTQVPEQAMAGMMEKYWNTLAEIAQERYSTITKIESFA